MSHSDAISQILESCNPWWSSDRVASAYPVRRDLQRVVLDRLTTEARRALLIRGPRQVGKTVLLLQTGVDLLAEGVPAANLVYFRFDDERLRARITPREVLDLVRPGNPELPIFCLFDELTSAADWSVAMKLAVDRGGYRIVATDSSARLLRQGSRESGLGRWDELELETLTFREALRLQALPGESPRQVLLRSPGIFYRFLRTGGFPEHTFSENLRLVDERLRSDISDRAIGRDLLTHDVARIQRLFAYLAQTSGGLANYAGIAGDLGADQRSIKEWIALLQDAMLVSTLEQWTTRPSQRLRPRSKLYVADAGLVSVFSTAPSPLDDSDVLGRSLETLVFRELRERCRRHGGNLAYFRNDKGQEVDFIWDSPRGRVVLEVGSRYRSEKAGTLLEVSERMKAAFAWQLHPGPVRGGRGSLLLEDFLLEDEAAWRKVS